MKITVEKDFRTFKKGDVIDFGTIKDIKSITLVGNNGCGKSSLIQTIRGFKHDLKEDSLFRDDYKKLTENVKIESEYEKIFIYDSIKDDGSHFMNAYDAVNYIGMGGYANQRRSHGESSLNNLITFFQKFQDKIVKEKTLVVLDELDKGFSLQAQTVYLNFVNKLIGMGCHVIVVTHNVFAIKQSILVYDLEKRDLTSADKYIETITGYKFERAYKS
jgi:predicted ATPase